MTLARFHYEPSVLEDEQEVDIDISEYFDADGEKLTGTKTVEVETYLDGYSVFDRTRGSRHTVAFCGDRDDAEQIVNALNMLERLQKAGLA